MNILHLYFILLTRNHICYVFSGNEQAIVASTLPVHTEMTSRTAQTYWEKIASFSESLINIFLFRGMLKIHQTVCVVLFLVFWLVVTCWLLHVMHVCECVCINCPFYAYFWRISAYVCRCIVRRYKKRSRKCQLYIPVRSSLNVCLCANLWQKGWIEEANLPVTTCILWI